MCGSASARTLACTWGVSAATVAPALLGPCCFAIASSSAARHTCTIGPLRHGSGAQALITAGQRAQRNLRTIAGYGCTTSSATQACQGGAHRLQCFELERGAPAELCRAARGAGRTLRVPARGKRRRRGVLMPQSFADQLRSIPMSPNLGQSLERAHRSARDQQHRLVTLEHLLLALTE